MDDARRSSMTTMSIRINAHLDESRSRKLEFLSRATDLSTSDILKQAIDLYYEQVRSRRPPPAEVLSDSGFIITIAPEKSSRASKAPLAKLPRKPRRLSVLASP